MLESIFIVGTLPASVERGFYQMPLVALSYAVACFASYTMLSLVSQFISTNNPNEKRLFHWGGAFALGAGIWSMHFIGMLSYRMNMWVEYDPVLTIASMLTATAFAYGVMEIVARPSHRLRQLALGAVLLGIGICSMHYIGMAAMMMDADLRYRPTLFFISVLIAIGASAGALWFAFHFVSKVDNRFRDLYQIGAALIMGAAICGMHYTGMSAAVFIPFANCRYDLSQDYELLAISVAMITGIILMLALATGISRKRMAELRVQNSERTLRAIIDTSLDAVIVMDHWGKVDEWNQQAESIFGITAAEAKGQPLAELIIPEAYRGRHHIELAHFLATGESPFLNKRLELNALRHGTLFPVELTITAQPAPEGYYFTAFIRDITDRKKAEQALQEADRRKDEFLATLAHELRNPIAPLSNALDILQLKTLTPERFSEAVKIMKHEVQHMVHLVDDLLDVSRISHGKIALRMERTLLNDAIQSAIVTTTPLMQANKHHFSADIPEQPLWLNADPLRLSQIFVNLLNNAAKYTQPGGFIRLEAEVDGEEVAIRVKDNGIGIPRHMLPKIFDMFTQVDSSIEKAHGGLGIGLMLVKSLVEMHKGSIAVSSPGLNQGSVFTVKLKLAEAPLQTPVPENEPVVGKPARPLNVLIVDDNIESARTLGWIVEMLGHTIRTVHDGASALEAVKTFIPDAVLLDVGMPGMSGYEVCKKLRENPALKHTVMIAQTGWGQQEHRQQSKEAGFDHHLVKPVDMDSLQKVLSGIS